MQAKLSRVVCFGLLLLREGYSSGPENLFRKEKERKQEHETIEVI
jgi:hypothetical protein